MLAAIDDQGRRVPLVNLDEGDRVDCLDDPSRMLFVRCGLIYASVSLQPALIVCERLKVLKQARIKLCLIDNFHVGVVDLRIRV